MRRRTRRVGAALGAIALFGLAPDAVRAQQHAGDDAAAGGAP
ncbi:hypothetical protein B1M_01778, partial [Burkholderia sp. TJI49]